MRPEIINEIKKRFGIQGEIQFVRKVANWIYFSAHHDWYIRITASSHRSEKELLSELDWIDYLMKNGMKVSYPVESSNKKNIESIESEGSLFFVSVFVAAKGKRIFEIQDYDDALFVEWGSYLGKLHHFANSYQPTSNIVKRPKWDREEYHQDICNQCKESDENIFSEFRRLEKLMYGLPIDQTGYGLIHADFHCGNFNVDEGGKITLFDFDDSVYHWFVYDIAVIFWSLEDLDLNWEQVKASFFSGYLKHHTLSQFWVKLIPEFYRYRMILIYYFCQRSLSDPSFSENAKQWMQERMQKTREFFALKKQVPIF